MKSNYKILPLSDDFINRLQPHEIESITMKPYKLSDLYIYAHKSYLDKIPDKYIEIDGFGGVLYFPIKYGPIYRTLESDNYSIYEDYFSHRKNGKTVEFFKKQIEYIRKTGYDKNNLIVINKTIQKILGHTIINDGHHRASILMYLFGDLKINIAEMEKPNDETVILSQRK